MDRPTACVLVSAIAAIPASIYLVMRAVSYEPDRTVHVMADSPEFTGAVGAPDPYTDDYDGDDWGDEAPFGFAGYLP